jgi:hypothetical protein
MIGIPQIRLLDGPLVQVSRSEKVKRMAADLVRFDSFRTETGAMRSLMTNGYSAFDIFTMIDDARQVAMQSVVAVEMSRS